MITCIELYYSCKMEKKSPDSTTMPTKPPTAILDRAAIVEELQFFVAKTMSLACAGKPYEEVIAHIGSIMPQDQEALGEDDNTVASMISESLLFSEIFFHLGDGDQSNQIVAMNFIAEPGTFTMDDMEAVFGPWHRIPAEDEGTLFVLAWFPRYDKSNGAEMFLYADDAGKPIRIASGNTPGRIFFTTEYELDGG